MSDPGWRIRLWDMLASAEKIMRFTEGLTKSQFISNELVIDAVIRNFEIIGMASRHIPPEAKAELPGIAWAEIWGMRNRLAHEYAQIDLELVWVTIEESIPLLILNLRPVVDDWSNKSAP